MFNYRRYRRNNRNVDLLSPNVADVVPVLDTVRRRKQKKLNFFNLSKEKL